MSRGTSRPTALLDVDVLIALAWPNHEGHRVARDWFAANAVAGWATTPVTESGFVRVSSNRHALPTATTPGVALDMLGRLTALDGHIFWPDGVRLVLGGHLDTSVVSGHRQVTDAHLLALCLENAGTLVTFDRGVPALVPTGRTMVEILENGPA
ncbi:MAG: type II toxin-antitoxin system VapC family toxin [Actinomycetota bacterium]|nr:type II toxin-antitoxin system VapC family toxin [Actinomycetota bacterium]